MIDISAPLNCVLPNPWQPREGENLEHVQNLARSIAADGLLQKPVGRLVDAAGNQLGPQTALDFTAGHRVQLAFGHSRLAAFYWLHSSPDAEDLRSGLAGEWSRLPVLVRMISDEEMFRLAISENLQRRDLTAIEEARAMVRYRDEFGKTSAEIGGLFGLSDSAVRNKIRLLKLPAIIQDMLRARTISEGAARALIGLYDIAEDKRAWAEQDTGELRPSEIIELALAGTAPAQIAGMVEQLAARIDPQPVQMAFDASTYRPVADLVETPVPEVEDAENAEDAGAAVEAMQAAAAQFRQESMDSRREEKQAAAVSVETKEEPEEETLDFSEEAKTAPAQPVLSKPSPISTPAPTPAARHAPSPAATTAPTSTPSVPTPEPPAKPPSWAESTITLSLTFWPDDGSADGRLVAIGGRVNQGAPKMRMLRQAALDMPGQLAELFAELNNEYAKTETQA